MASTSRRSFLPVPGALAALLVVVLVSLAVSCGDDDITAAPPESVDGVTVRPGFVVEVVVEGLDRPTQVAPDDDGRFLVAQLAGDEGAGVGEIVLVDPAAPDEHEVLHDGLRTPTGVALVDGVVWVMEQRRLSAAPLGEPLAVVLDELPNNGRSQGTLTPAPDGGVLYDTSGRLVGGRVVEGSGALWSVEAGSEPELVATGFKHAYAHTYDAEGRLWTTEIGDGRYDGTAPADELVAVTPGADHGWPRCVGDNRPVAEYGGDDASCAEVPPSVAVFDAGATPTSVAVAPWAPRHLVVALWNRGEVVTVDGSEPDRWPVEPETLLTGIEHPQHLLADGDRLLVVDHGGGRILAVTPAASGEAS